MRWSRPAPAPAPPTAPPPPATPAPPAPPPPPTPPAPPAAAAAGAPPRAGPRRAGALGSLRSSVLAASHPFLAGPAARAKTLSGAPAWPAQSLISLMGLRCFFSSASSSALPSALAHRAICCPIARFSRRRFSAASRAVAFGGHRRPWGHPASP
ncbi:MAG: hypothetical protein DI545_03335 [Micrococcus luteus]|nr:MAG: hypothetical protein DI545_03335 [Micrococcus luteus]